MLRSAAEDRYPQSPNASPISGSAVAKKSSERWSIPDPSCSFSGCCPLQATSHERPEADQHVRTEARILEPGDDELDALGTQTDDLRVAQDLLDRLQGSALAADRFPCADRTAL